MLYANLHFTFESESEVAQSCLTLWDPMDTRLLRPWDFLGKSTGVGCHFLLQGTSLPRDRTQVSHIVNRCFTIWATREANLHFAFEANSNSTLSRPLGFPDGSMVKHPLANAEDLGSILGLGRSPEGGHHNPLQYFRWRMPWIEEPGGL